MSETRIACMVPGCRRTTLAERLAPHTQWLCPAHWPLVDRQLKLLLRRMRRRFADGPLGLRIDGWLWARRVAQAIERSAGL